MKIEKLKILPVVGMVAAFMAFSGGQAQAAHLVCGQTITTNTTLDADLTCTTTPGLIIGANGVTVDLNGFTLSGVACAKCHGIRNGDIGTSGPGFNGVTIKNGTIVGFEQGIRAQGAPGKELTAFKIMNVNLTKATSSSVIDILDSKNVKIEHVTIFIPSTAPGTVEAIRLESVTGVKVSTVHVDGGAVGVNFGCAPCPDPNGPTNGTIENSTFANNGNGIILFDTTKATVKWNVVTGSTGSGIIVGLGFITGVFGPVSNVGLFGNTVDGSGGNGILMGAASASNVSYNTLTRNTGNGISLIGSTGNNLVENAASSNTGDGVDLDSTSTGNVLEENTANGNGVFGYDDATTGGTGTLGTDNIYVDNRCLVNTTAGSDPSGLCVPQP